MNSKVVLGLVLFVSILFANGKTEVSEIESAINEGDAKERFKRQAPTTAPSGGEQEIEIEETTAAPTTTTKAPPTLAPYPRPHPVYQRPQPPPQPTITNVSYRRQHYLGQNPTNSQVWPGSQAATGTGSLTKPRPQPQWPPRSQPTKWPRPTYQHPTFSNRQAQRPASFSGSLGPKPAPTFNQRNDMLSALSIGRSISRSQRQTLSLTSVNNKNNKQSSSSSVRQSFAAPPKQKVGSNCPTFLYTTRNNIVEFHTVPGQCKIAVEFPPPGFYGHPKVRYFAKSP